MNPITISLADSSKCNEIYPHKVSLKGLIHHYLFQKKAKKAEFQATEDPQLAMALALSASLASNENDVDGGKDIAEIDKKEAQKCWLPQVIISILIHQF